ncbi:ependymin-like [Arapaima gigas]
MQFFAVVFLSLSLAVNVGTQKPHPCRSPPLLDGSLSVTPLTGEYFAFTKYTYDALGQRLRFREFGYQHNQSFHMDILMLFRQGKLYNISYHDQTCEKRALNASFHPMEVPRGAKFQNQLILGSSSGPGQGLLVNTWTGEVPEVQGKYYATFTEFGCLPVSNFYYSERTGWVIVSFFNNVLGIENPEDFFPPPFCDTEEKETEDVVTDFFFFL